jgi:hypothetical protein
MDHSVTMSLMVYFSAFNNEEKSILNDFLHRVDSNVVTATNYAIKRRY